MAISNFNFARSVLMAAACSAIAQAAQAQSSVTITGRSLGSAAVAGFGDALAALE